jgi:phospholipid transport system transporter-binding protein
VAAAALSECGPGRWRLDGDLALPQVARLAAGPPPAGDTGSLELDLAGVGRTSSAAVALMLHWQAGLRACGSRLVLVNAPQSLHRLAALSNVDGLLGLTDATTAAAADTGG